MVGGLVGVAGPWSSWLPDPVEAGSCWLAGLGREAAHCRMLQGPGANTDPLVGRARFWGGWFQGWGSQIYCQPAGRWAGS